MIDSFIFIFVPKPLFSLRLIISLSFSRQIVTFEIIYDPLITYIYPQALPNHIAVIITFLREVYHFYATFSMDNFEVHFMKQNDFAIGN